MPGIFGCVDTTADSDQLAHVGERMRLLSNTHRAAQRFIEDALIFPPFLLGYHSLRRFESRKGFAQSDSLTIVFDGILFKPSPQPDVTQLLSLYRQRGLVFANRLRGHFALAV